MWQPPALPVSAKPDQQRSRPQLLVRHVAPELVGEVQPQLAECEIQIRRDRRLYQTRTRRCLLGQPTNVGEASADVAALSEQEFEGLGGDVVPCDTTAPASLLQELEPTSVGVQRVGHEVTAKSTTGRTATERLDTMLGWVRQRCATRSDWRRIDLSRTASGSLLHAICEPLCQLVALGSHH